MIFLWAVLSFASETPDIVAVDEGKTVQVEGPGVFMNASRFRRYVADSRNLPLCEESLEKALAAVIEANERTLKVRELVEEELDITDEEDAAQVQTIAEQAVKIDTLSSQLVQARTQRNVAWGVAGGFLAAATAATVLVLVP